MFGICLHQHLQHAPVTVEIVGVGRTEIDRQGIVHVGHRQAHGAGLNPVHFHMQLWRGRLVFGSKIGEQAALHRHAEHLIARCRQGFTPYTGAVLQLHGEAAGLSERLDCGRLDGEDHRIVDAHEGAHRTADQRLRRTFRAAAFAPILERGEHDGIVLTLTEEAEAAHHDDPFDFFLRRPEAFDRGDGFIEPFARGPRGGLHNRNGKALVFGREEAARQAEEQQCRDKCQHEEDGQAAHGPTENAFIGPPVFFGHAPEPAVELSEEATAAPPQLFDTAAPSFWNRFLLGVFVDLVGVVGLDILRAQECGAESRRQRQREDRGEENGNSQRDRELAVNAACRSGEEGHRHEDCNQHQRDPDDRTGDLIHRLAGRLDRAETLFAHDAFDVLDHDDGIVDQNTDRQHHAEQGQHVDGKAEQPQAQTGACKRNGHYQCRYQRSAPVLQEQEHDQEDEDHGLDQRLDDLFDRDLDEGRGVVGNRPGDVLRQAVAQLFHPLLHAFGGGQGIGAGSELDGHARHGLAVESGGGGVALRADFHACDIAQANAGTPAIRPQDNAAELFFGLEAAFRGNRRRDLLPFLQWQVADRTTGRLGVLFANCRHDCAGREIVGSQLFRIEPDTHRVGRAKQRDIPDAGDAAQFIDHLIGGDIAQIGRVQSAGFGRQGDDHQEAGVRLTDGNTLSPDLLGQTRFDCAQTVLNFGLGDVDISAGFEG